jgi:hypothetical protein
MSSNVLEEYADAKYRLRIEVDDYPDSPRRWGPLSVIVAWHSNYNFSDTDEYDTPQDFVREMKRVKQQFYPLYLMDHSSLTLRTEPFGGLYGYWDSGQVGFVYIPDAKLREHLGVKRLTKEHRARCKEIIDGEIEVYTEYVNGSVFRFTIEAREPDCSNCDGEDPDCCEYEEDAEYATHVDSCGGFYGYDSIKTSMKEQVEPELQYLFDKI